ncbi:hypothetical protein [uncultured Desulfuromonas sp.]|uniref:hypothetical protein n=1 Tax=uncultured Desulfuromonas sp. TaxID=181013 RepID=UPI002639FB5F|nr:hypothetical protein [uncultured Desulfuromonas sp.]
MSNNNTNLAQVLPFPAADEHLNRSQRPWLDTLAQPAWLASALHSDEWILGNKVGSPLRPQKIRWKQLLSDGTYLTDPENASFLKSLQLIAYHMRSRAYSNITSPATHKGKVQKLISLVQWMVLKRIKSFGRLTLKDLDDFLAEVKYGISGLMNLHERFDRHVQKVRSQGDAFPVTAAGHFAASSFCEEFGCEPYMLRSDTLITWKGVEIALEQGLKIKPANQEKYLDTLPDGTQIMAEPPEIQVITSASIEDTLWAWLDLWEHRKYVDDKLTFMPFGSIESLKKRAHALGREGARTGTIPEKQAAELIDRAIRWVLFYGDDLFALKDIYDAASREFREKFGPHQGIPHLVTKRLVFIRKAFAKYRPTSQGKGSPWPVDPALMHSDGLSLFDALYVLLPAACSIVIGAFTARRHIEILTIKEDCISFENDGAWIETWIEKTVQNWDKTPCPKVVVRAVEVLKRLSQMAREKTGESYLFRFQGRWAEEGENNGVKTFEMGKGLRGFAAFVKVSPLDDGSFWDFKPHQFRRFFAMLYMWRYSDRLKSLEALRNQLRHASVERTMHYVTEIRPGEVFEKANAEENYRIVNDVAFHRSGYVGEFAKRFGKTIDKLTAVARKQIVVLTEQNVQRRIERYLEKHQTHIVPLPWGFCAVETHEPIETACCLKSVDGAKVTRLSHSDPANCAHCERFLADDSFRQYWEMQALKCETVANNKSNPPLMRNWQSERAKKFRRGIAALWQEEDNGS